MLRESEASSNPRTRSFALRFVVTGSSAFADDDTGKVNVMTASDTSILLARDRFIVPLDAPAAREAGRVGPKAANLAALGAAGLPTPGGFCLAADAYRAQIASLGLGDAIASFATAVPREQRRLAVDIRLALYQRPIAPDILAPLLEAWREQRAASGGPGVVRSSALIEDRSGATCAGQFESFLGIADADALLTAVRACWAALWTSQARGYMERHGLSPAGTAMAILIQPLIDARASGGGLSENGEGQMILSAAWGLGSSIAQGEIVPDRIVLSRAGFLRTNEAGRKDSRDACGHGAVPGASAGIGPQAVPRELMDQPCLDAGAAVALGRLLRRAEAVLGGPTEIEWALDDSGFKLLQARPLVVAPATVPDEIWLKHPRLNGHPAGVGWAAGRAVVVNCECELSRIAPGDVLVTRVAGPALGQVLPRVAGVVAELGGSTSHLASLARERGIPMVLGVRNATAKIPDGAQVAVDGVAGIVRWIG
jgi:pyruvate,water dikinase